MSSCTLLRAFFRNASTFLVLVCVWAGLLNLGGWAFAADSKPPGQASAVPPVAATKAAPNPQELLRKVNSDHPIFIENRGQFDSRAKYQVVGPGGTLWLTPDGIVFDFVRPKKGTQPVASGPGPQRGPDSKLPKMERVVFKQKFVAANPNTTLEAHDPLPGIYNYFIGKDPNKWRTHVKGYVEVLYRDVWTGVDLRLSANGANLEEEFIVHPDANASAIQVAYEGVQGVALASDGSLKVTTAFGDINESSPHLYQEIAGKPVPLSGSFKVGAQNSYSFEVSKYNQQADLVIDPTIIYSSPRTGKRSQDQGSLLYSTYLGGSAGILCCTQVTEYANGIAVDGAGSAYVVGSTTSNDFPVTQGAYQTHNNYQCGFVTKFTPLGDQQQYSTYLCGQNSGGAIIYGIAVDSAGEAYVTGFGGANFPTTPNAFQKDVDWAFATALSAAGDALVYSSGFGYGSVGNSVAVDSSGRAYFAGYVTGSIPTTPNAFQSTFPGYQAAFIGVLDPSQSGQASLVYGSYLGGSRAATAQGVAVDAYNMAYLTGYTESQDFPVTPGAFQTSYAGGGQDAFVTKFNPHASSGPASVLYSTYLGGGGHDYGYAVAVDNLGNATVTGLTGSGHGYELPGFPTTPGALQPNWDDAWGDWSGFVAKLNVAGNNLIFSTYWGGNSAVVNGIATDAFGNSYAAGHSSGLLLVTADAFQPQYLGGSLDTYGQADSLVSKFDSAGNLIYSSYLGGTGYEQALGVAIDAVGDAYLTGFTTSLDFPVTPFAFQPQINPGGSEGPDDAFVTKFPLGSGAISISAILPNVGGNAGNVTPQILGTGFHNGATAQLACGGTNVPGSNVSVSAGGQIVTATFDLTSTTPGMCDVVVTNPDLSSARLSQGFTVQQGGAADVRLNKTATGSVPGLNTVYGITACNAGNIDSPPVVLSEFIEPWFTYQNATPNPSEILTNPVEWPPSKIGDGETYNALLNWQIPTVPAQSAQPLSYVVQLDTLFPVGQNITGQVCGGSDPSIKACNVGFDNCAFNLYAGCLPICLTGPENCAACYASAFTYCYLGRSDCLRMAGLNWMDSLKDSARPVPNERAAQTILTN